jgi:hypothetical protein
VVPPEPAIGVADAALEFTQTLSLLWRALIQK